MSLTKITTRGHFGAPFNIWQATTETDLANTSFWPDPGDVVSVVSTGATLMCLEGGGFIWLSTGAPIPPALVASAAAAAATTSGNATTAGINTTGATLLVAAMGYTGTAPAVSDSKSNTWTTLAAYGHVVMAYCANPTVGSAHTFTATASGADAPAIAIAAFNGTLVSGANELDIGANQFIASKNTGSGTPAHDNDLIVTGMGFQSGTLVGVTSPFTVVASINAGTVYGAAIAYATQTIASSVSATWTQSAASNMSVALTAFQP